MNILALTSDAEVILFQRESELPGGSELPHGDGDTSIPIIVKEGFKQKKRVSCAAWSNLNAHKGEIGARHKNKDNQRQQQ